MNAIAQNQPKILYLFSDGPRNDDEKSLLTKNRELMVSMVDWDCELKTYFFDENYGAYNIWKKLCDIVFIKEDSMIYLQEDILTSNTFFRFCDELLNYYQD